MEFILFCAAVFVWFWWQGEQEAEQRRAEHERIRREKDEQRIEKMMRDPASGFYNPPDWEERREYILRRDGRCCTRCSSRESLHVHHVVYRSVKYDHSAANLITLCHKCHGEEHGMTFLHNDVIAENARKRNIAQRASRGTPVRARTSHWCEVCEKSFGAGTSYVNVKTKDLVSIGRNRHYASIKVCEGCYSTA